MELVGKGRMETLSSGSRSGSASPSASEADVEVGHRQGRQQLGDDSGASGSVSEGTRSRSVSRSGSEVEAPEGEIRQRRASDDSRVSSYVNGAIGSKSGSGNGSELDAIDSPHGDTFQMHPGNADARSRSGSRSGSESAASDIGDLPQDYESRASDFANVDVKSAYVNRTGSQVGAEASESPQGNDSGVAGVRTLDARSRSGSRSGSEIAASDISRADIPLDYDSRASGFAIAGVRSAHVNRIGSQVEVVASESQQGVASGDVRSSIFSRNGSTLSASQSQQGEDRRSQRDLHSRASGYVIKNEGSQIGSRSGAEVAVHVSQQIQTRQVPTSFPVHVELVTFAGEPLGALGKFVLESSEPILALSQQIAVQLRVPIDCQQLLIGDTTASSRDTLGSYCEKDFPSIVVGLALVLDPLWLQLIQDKAKLQRAAAEKSFEHLLAYFPGTMDMLCRFLDDQRQDVRNQVIGVLSRSASKGDASALDRLYTCVDHAHEDVRARALRALSSVAERGDRRSIDIALDSLTDRRSWVREEGLFLLSLVAEPEDPDVIAAILLQLDDARDNVSNVALLALESLAKKGNPVVVDTFIRFLENSDVDVREIAVQGLAKAIDPSSAHEVDLIISALDDDSSSVRDAVTHSLIHILLPSMDTAELQRAAAKSVQYEHILDNAPRVAKILNVVEALHFGSTKLHARQMDKEMPRFISKASKLPGGRLSPR